MDLQSIAERIEKKIDQLEYLKDKLKETAEDKANSIGEYDKALAETIMKIRNDGEVSLGKNKIENVPVSVMDKVAKGVCYQQKINMDLAETRYKNLISMIDIIKAQLNGYQSILRNQTEM